MVSHVLLLEEPLQHGVQLNMLEIEKLSSNPQTKLLYCAGSSAFLDKLMPSLADVMWIES